MVTMPINSELFACTYAVGSLLLHGAHALFRKSFKNAFAVAKLECGIENPKSIVQFGYGCYLYKAEHFNKLMKVLAFFVIKLVKNTHMSDKTK